MVLMKRERSDLDTAQWKRIRKAVLNRDQHTCTYCGQQATSVDHIIPPSAAPERKHDMDNLVAACIPCNSKRGGAQRIARQIFLGSSPTPSITADFSLPARIWPDASPFDLDSK